VVGFTCVEGSFSKVYICHFVKLVIFLFYAYLYSAFDYIGRIVFGSWLIIVVDNIRLHFAYKNIFFLSKRFDIILDLKIKDSS